MRHSIARSILQLLLTISLLFTGAMVIFTVKAARSDAYEHSQMAAAYAAQSLSLSYSSYDGNASSANAAISEKVQATMEQLLRENDLLFLYIVVPDRQEYTLAYEYLVGSEDVQFLVDAVLQNPIQKNVTFSDAMLHIMDGSSRSEYIEMNNDFGHVISAYVPLYDEDNNVIAVIGADISISRMEHILMESLPQKILFFLIIGMLSPVVLYVFMKKNVIHPAEMISRAMEEFGQDDTYNTPPLSLSCDNEFGRIEASFNSMASNIRDNVERIKAYTEIQNRQAYELNAASRIQQGFLPAPTWEDSFCEIHACMNPAKNVGGDFFDYFTCNGQTVLIIADVSGKGLSGALFMASAITLIRGFAKRFADPKDVMTAVNQELEHTNPDMMFVTVFLAYVDRTGGTIRYCNAGHNPPYCLIDGKIKAFANSSGMPLGIMADEVYETTEEFLPLGSTLFFYTDGVTEAQNSEHTFFGTDRLEQLLRAHQGSDTIPSVLEELSRFSAGCDQYDDITMLTFTSKAKELCLPAKESCFSQLRSWILEDDTIPAVVKNELRLMAEELFINIASYSYSEDGGNVLIRKQVLKDGTCLLQLTDSGIPFDSTENIQDIDEYDPYTQIGGLGRFMVESIADVWHYTNIEGNNIQLVIIRCEDSQTDSEL